MKNATNFALSFLLCLSLSAQSPVLVSDFTLGPDDTFDFRYTGANGSDFAILATDFLENGQEPIILKDGELTLLDLVPGSDSSQPKHFMEIGGLVYFSSKFLDDASAIWRTDGTEEGTVRVFESENSGTNYITGILETDSGEIYFTNVDDLYRINGDTSEFVISGVSFSDFSQFGPSQVPYGSHFVFLRKETELELVEYDGTDLNVLGTTPAGFISNFYGLGVVDGGLIFHISDFSDETIEGVYVYRESESMIVKKNIEVVDPEPRRSFNLNNKLQVYLFYGDGWYTIDANGDGPKEIIQSEFDYWLQGYSSKVNGDKFIFQSSDPFGDDPTISISDGTKAGTKVLMTAEASYFSHNFLIHKEYIIFADGTSNGFDANIYYINTETEDWGKLYQFSGNVINGQNFNPVYVEGDKLYFTSEDDADIGTEMYYLQNQLFDPVSISDTKILSQLNVKYFEESLQVLTNENEALHLEIYNVSGSLIQKVEARTNEIISFSSDQKTLVFRFILEDGEYSEIKVFH